MFSKDFDRTLIIIAIFALIAFVIYIDNQNKESDFDTVLATLLTAVSMIVAFHFKSNGHDNQVGQVADQKDSDKQSGADRIKSRIRNNKGEQ